MNPSIKVSVIIPVYNAEKYLRECLDSVIRQSLKDIEIICVDDGSTDQSLAILQEYEEKDSRVKVLTQKNQYAGVARNHGMQMAQGEYVAFLDADDFFAPDALTKLFSIAKKHCLDMVKGRFCYIDTQTQKRFTSLFSLNSSIGCLLQNHVINFNQFPERILNAADVPWNGLYRRAFLDQNQISFNSLICVNDHSFYIHCLMKVKRLMFIRTIITYYRVHQANSLIGKKAFHFDAQIASYQIVHTLCRGYDSMLKQKILQNECNHLFYWYKKLYIESNSFQVSAQKFMQQFLQSFDIKDVGNDFLMTCSYWETYWTLRFGTPAPPRIRLPPLKRLLRCYHEHGLKYTLITLYTKLGGKTIYHEF